VIEVGWDGSSQSHQAALAMALLEAAERAEGTVHGLSARPVLQAEEDRAHDQAAALAGGWLRARATELAARLGNDALTRCSAALLQIARGWMREASDLYDAARSPELYHEATAGTRGSLGSLAAALGGLAANRTEPEVSSLAIFGAKLGAAAKVSDDVAALAPESSATGRAPGASLLSGVYTLPVIFAVEAEPGLRTSLGGAIQPDGLADLVARIRATDGPARSASECRSLAEEAIAAIDGLESTERLAAHAVRAAERCEEAVAR
jgi:heptaprenyl diphosphate synthase